MKVLGVDVVSGHISQQVVKLNSENVVGSCLEIFFSSMGRKRNEESALNASMKEAEAFSLCKY